MPKTLVGFVYDKQTLRLHRIIVPDDDSEVLDNRHIGPGEDIVTWPYSEGYSIDAAYAAIANKTGRVPSPHKP